MSSHTTSHMPPPPTPRSKGAWAGRIIQWSVIVFAVAIFLAGVYVLLGPELDSINPVRVSASAAPDAVQVSVSDASLNRDASPDGPTLAIRLITDSRIVADLYARINALPSVGPLPMHCTLPDVNAVSFGFRFLRAGMLVETAIQQGTDGCGEWWLSAGGVRESFPRWDPHGERQAIVDAVQPLGCPQAWLPKCAGY